MHVDIWQTTVEMKNRKIYTVRVQRQLLEWVDIPVKAETPEQAERTAKRQALRATEWQRVQTAKPYGARTIVPYLREV